MKKIAWGAVALAGVLAGCPSGTSTAPLTGADATVLTEESALYDVDSTLTFATVDPFADATFVAPGVLAKGFDPAQAATTAAAKAGNYFQPSSCVHATANGAVATYVLNHCKGSFGFTDGTGTFTATYAANAANKLEVTLAGKGLHVEGVGYDVNAVAVAIGSGATRTVDLSSQTTLAGTATTRATRSTLAWTRPTGCITINGTGTRVGSGPQYSLNVHGFKSCSSECPTTGTLTASGPSGPAKVTYDGSSTPNAVSGTGASGTIDVVCQ